MRPRRDARSPRRSLRWTRSRSAPGWRGSKPQVFGREAVAGDMRSILAAVLAALFLLPAAALASPVPERDRALLSERARQPARQQGNRRDQAPPQAALALAPSSESRPT